jgi:hypothetical protein
MIHADAIIYFKFSISANNQSEEKEGYMDKKAPSILTAA